MVTNFGLPSNSNALPNFPSTHLGPSNSPSFPLSVKSPTTFPLPSSKSHTPAKSSRLISALPRVPTIRLIQMLHNMESSRNFILLSSFYLHSVSYFCGGINSISYFLNNKRAFQTGQGLPVFAYTGSKIRKRIAVLRFRCLP